MRARFVPPTAPMHLKIKAMQNDCIAIAEENKSRSEFGQHCPLVDNEVLLEALNQRDQLLEALKDARLYVDMASKNCYNPVADKVLAKIDAAIAAAEGE